VSLAAVLKLHKPISWFPPIWTLACGHDLVGCAHCREQSIPSRRKDCRTFRRRAFRSQVPVRSCPAPKRGTPDCRRAETPLSLRSGVALSRPDRRSNNSRWRAQAGPGILAAGVAAMSEELHTESHRSVADQAEMPLPSELSTAFLGGPIPARAARRGLCGEGDRPARCPCVRPSSALGAGLARA